jgi:hypothetical protein
MANPTCIQIRITMSMKLLILAVSSCSHDTGANPSQVMNALSSPIWGWPSGRTA